METSLWLREAVQGTSNKMDVSAPEQKKLEKVTPAAQREESEVNVSVRSSSFGS